MSTRKQRRSLPRCTALTVDGSQCGRRVADGSNPPICHVHKAVAQGTSHSAMTEPATFDGLKELRRLTRSTDDRVRLRAVDLLIELERKEAAKRDRSMTPHGEFGARVLLDAMTPEEREAIGELITRLRDIQRGVYRRRRDLPRPDWFVAEKNIITPASAPREDVLEEAPSEAPAPVVEDVLGPDEEYI
jgi:hypothetical protein